jgi:hypothetical protein
MLSICEQRRAGNRLFVAVTVELMTASIKKEIELCAYVIFFTLMQK